MASGCVTYILYISAVVVGAYSLKIETPNYSYDEYKTFLGTISDIINTLSSETPDLVVEKSLDTGGINLQFSTDNDFKYHFIPVSSTSMKFSVKASCDVSLTFSPKPFVTNTSTELIIGGARNTKTFFQQNRIKEEVKTPGIVNGTQYRKFLLRWGDGVILLWRDGEHRPFITWVESNSEPIRYIGVKTSAGVKGAWKVEDLAVGPVNGTRKNTFILNFKVRSPSDAHIGLFTKPAVNQGQMIEILLGGWANTKCLIRRGNYNWRDVLTVELPGVMSVNEYRGFWLHWGDVISVGREGEDCPFLSWTDPEPFQVTHLGIHTGYGAAGDWKIEDWEEVHTPDSMEYKFQPFAVLSGLSEASSIAIDSW